MSTKLSYYIFEEFNINVVSLRQNYFYRIASRVRGAKDPFLTTDGKKYYMGKNEKFQLITRNKI